MAPFYFLGGVREIIPIYPLYAIMFGEHGISPLELSLLFMIWAAVGILFEIPSGALADRFSRKWLIVASSVLKSCAFLCWYCWPEFFGFALGFILWGLGSTLRSGAIEALLHDLLAAQQRAAEFSRHYGRMTGLGTLGVVIGELSGGLLIAFGYDMVLLVSAVMPLIATIPFLLLVHSPTRADVPPDYLANLRVGVAEAIHSRQILYILLAYSLLIVTFGVYDEYVPPTLFEKGFPLELVAFLCVPILLAQSIGQGLAHHFEGLGLQQLLTMMGVSAVPLLLIPTLTGGWIVLLLIAFFFMFGLSTTLFQASLQAAISGTARATVTSVVSLGDGIGGIFWFAAFGLMAEMGTMSGAAAGLGFCVLILSLMFKWLARYWLITRG
ncbi:MAG: MFS transporter [Proteobacteria bacterium]|nr:MFS transporter [Pseudomonadota bacterium]